MTRDGKEVLNAVNSRREDILNYLEALIKIPSVTGQEKECQEFVGKTFHDMNLDVDIWEPSIEEISSHPAYVTRDANYRKRPNVVGVWRGSGGRSLLLNGHIDVVDPGPLELWKYGPWSGTAEGCRIYGRGSCDMKGGLAATIWALRCILEAGLKPKGDVILESVVDEEIGGNGTLAAIIRSYKADAGIFAEPTDLQLHLAHRGSQFFRITVWGKGAHCGLRFEGVSAVEKGIGLCDAIEKIEKKRDERVGKPHWLYRNYPISAPITIGRFDGGIFPSIVPEKCIVEGAIDIMPGETVREVREEFLSEINSFSQSDRWLREHPPKVEWFGSSMEGGEISQDHPIVACVVNSYRKATGKNPHFGGLPAGSDMRLATKHGDTPSLIFGPGNLLNAHTHNEYVPIEDVITSTKVLALAIAEWCGIQ